MNPLEQLGAQLSQQDSSSGNNSAPGGADISGVPQNSPIAALASQLGTSQSQNTLAPNAFGISQGAVNTANGTQGMSNTSSTGNFLQSFGAGYQGDQGSFMAGVENFNRVFGYVAEGTMDLVAKSIGANKIDQAVLNTRASLQKSADVAYQNHPIASGIGTATGIAASAVPFVVAGGPAGLAGNVAMNSGISGALGFLGTTGDIKDRLVNGGISAGLGAAAPLAMEGIGSAIGNIGRTVGVLPATAPESAGMMGKIFSPTKEVTNDVANEITNTGGSINDILATKVKFDNVGVPAALSDVVPEITGDLKSVAMNPAKRSQLQDFNTNQTNAVKGQVNDTLESIVPNGINAETTTKDALYKSLENKTVPDDVMSQLMQNPSIANKLKALNKDPDTGMANIPDNSMVKMEALRKDLADEAYGADTKPSVAANLKGVLKNFTDTLDNVDPTYQATREAGERVSLYNQFQDRLQRAQEVAGSGKELPLTKLYSTLVGAENQPSLVDAVQRIGGNVQNAKDLMDVLSIVKNSPLPKLASKANASSAPGLLQSIGTATAGGIGGGLLGGLHGATLGGLAGMAHAFGEWLAKSNYQNALLKLTIDPNWEKPLTQVLSQKATTTKISGLANLIRQVVGTNTNNAINRTPAITIPTMMNQNSGSTNP